MIKREFKEKQYKDLSNLGMVFNGSSFIGKYEYNMDFNIHFSELSVSEDMWDKLINEMKSVLRNRTIDKIEKDSL